MVAMATNSNITVPQKYTEKYKNVGYGWDTSHPTTISKKFIILIYHYPHAVTLPIAALVVPKVRALSRARKLQFPRISHRIRCTQQTNRSLLLRMLKLFTLPNLL